MKTNYWKTIGTFPPIRIAVPALRITNRARIAPQDTSLKRDELMSVYRQDLARVMEQRSGDRARSRAA